MGFEEITVRNAKYLEVKYNESTTYQNLLSADKSVNRNKFMTSKTFKKQVDNMLK